MRKIPDLWGFAKKSHTKGKIAEFLATWCLLSKLYKIKHKNIRSSLAEADIVAIKQHTLVIVEVKYRGTRESAHRAIRPTQKNRLLRKALELQEKCECDEIRLDAVLVFPHWPFVEHVKRAWEV